jgi:hypothetical protein
MLPFVVELLKGEEVSFMVNGTFYPRYYLLVDGIYPLGVVLCKPCMNPKTRSNNISPKCKEHKKMLKGHLVFSKVDGQYFKILANCGTCSQSLT